MFNWEESKPWLAAVDLIFIFFVKFVFIISFEKEECFLKRGQFEIDEQF